MCSTFNSLQICFKILQIINVSKQITDRQKFVCALILKNEFFALGRARIVFSVMFESLLSKCQTI